jgi:hypothetical protein
MQLEDEDGNIVDGGISADKNYKIKLVFEVKEMTSNLDLGIVFAFYDGTILFYSSPFDYIKNYQVHMGINVLYCSIPGDLLNINDYNVGLGSKLNNHEIITDPYADNTNPSKVMIRINVTAKSTINPFGLNKSILAPKFIWTEQ